MSGGEYKKPEFTYAKIGVPVFVTFVVIVFLNLIQM